MNETQAHETIRKLARKAQRRINVFSFCRIGLRTLFYVLLLDCLLFAGLKLTPWSPPFWATLGFSLALAIPLSWHWHRKTAKTLRAASIMVDRHLRLKEKISSALALADEPIASNHEAEWRKAQLADAIHAANRLDMRKAFPWASPSEAQWLWAPALALLMVAYLIPQWQLFTNSSSMMAQATELDRKKIEKETNLLLQRQLTLEKRSQEKRMSVASEMAKEIKDLAQDLSKGKLEKREALSKISSLEKTWEQKRDDLESMKQQTAKPMPFNQLKMTGELAKNIQAGNFEKAAEALQDLQKKLKMDGMSDESKKRLAEEMKELANSLDMNSPLMSALDAASMELAAGDLEAAMSSMNISEMALMDLEQLMAQLEMLEGELENLQACKLGVLGKCKACGGNCEGGQCQGTGPWSAGDSDKFGSGMGKAGIGRGGKAQFEETDTQLQKSTLQGDFHNAPLSGMMKVPGLPFQGESTLEFADSGIQSEQEREDALVTENVPVPYRNQVRAYFTLINQREGASSQNASSQ